MKGVFVLLITPQGECLVGGRRDGKGIHPAGALELPGGTVEEGESLKTTAIREVAEETTTTVSNGFVLERSRLEPFACFASPHGQITSYYYAYRLTEIEQQVLSRIVDGRSNFADREHTHFAWLGAEQLRALERLSMLVLHRDVVMSFLRSSSQEAHREIGVDKDLYTLRVSPGLKLWDEETHVSTGETLLVTYPRTGAEHQLHQNLRLAQLR